MKAESIKDILREMRRLAASSATICWADRIEEAWAREMAMIETANEADPTVDDVRICYLQDADLARDKAEEKYPEAVLSAKYADPLEVAKIARSIATNIHVRLDSGDRGILLLASYYAARFGGWEAKKFDKTEFDQAVSGPSAWDSVEDPVAEIRKMRGAKEDAK